MYPFSLSTLSTITGSWRPTCRQISSIAQAAAVRQRHLSSRAATTSLWHPGGLNSADVLLAGSSATQDEALQAASICCQALCIRCTLMSLVMDLIRLRDSSESRIMPSIPLYSSRLTYAPISAMDLTCGMVHIVELILFCLKVYCQHLLGQLLSPWSGTVTRRGLAHLHHNNMIHLWVLALIHSGVLVSHDGWLDGPAQKSRLPMQGRCCL